MRILYTNTKFIDQILVGFFLAQAECLCLFLFDIRVCCLNEQVYHRYYVTYFKFSNILEE
jgi:hypothetical protein